MKFTEFTAKQSKLQNKALLGMSAQIKLAPSYREAMITEESKLKKPRAAAVLALFYPNQSGDTTFLLTKRASYNGTHSAQISFPGGKREASDVSLSETALREAYEEVGIPTEQVIIVKEMTALYVPPSNFLISPYLAFTENRPDFVQNHEVAKIIEIPLKALLDDNSLLSKNKTDKKGNEIIIPYFKFNSNEVWGATAMILSEIKELIKNL